MTRNQYGIALSIALLGEVSLFTPPLAAQQSIRYRGRTSTATASSRARSGAATNKLPSARSQRRRTPVGRRSRAEDGSGIVQGPRPSISTATATSPRRSGGAPSRSSMTTAMAR